jgi:hypothetical protein
MKYVAIPNVVNQVEKMYRKTARNENLSVATIIAWEYKKIPRTPQQVQLENKILAGEFPPVWGVEDEDCGTPHAFEALTFIATVLLAAKYRLIKQVAA